MRESTTGSPDPHECPSPPGAGGSPALADITQRGYSAPLLSPTNRGQVGGPLPEVRSGPMAHPGRSQVKLGGLQ